jgi:hypothetical protein
MVGRDLKLVKDPWEDLAVCVPTLLIDEFRFTGATEF